MYITRNTEERYTERSSDSIITTIREAIEEGNAQKIVVRDRRGKDVTSVSLNAGIALGSFALIAGAAPLAVISGLIAKYGLDYDFVLVRTDGTEKYL